MNMKRPSLKNLVQLQLAFLLLACGPPVSPPVDLQLTISGLDSAVQAVHVKLTGAESSDERCNIKCGPIDPDKRTVECFCPSLFLSQYAVEIVTLDDVLESACVLGKIREPLDLREFNEPVNAAGRYTKYLGMNVPAIADGPMCCLRLNVDPPGSGGVDVFVGTQLQEAPGPACVEPSARQISRAVQFKRGTELSVKATVPPTMWLYSKTASKYGSGCVATTDRTACRVRLDRSTQIDVSFVMP
jgi:hypothetical protein